MKTSTTQALHTAALTGFLSLALLFPATAADFTGNLKGVTITDAANINKPPVAAFIYAVDGNIVNFDASSSTDPDGNITAYKWDFGDGSTSTDVSTTHTYTSNGDFHVTLTITDNAQGVTLYNQSVTPLINFAKQTTGDAETGNIHSSRTAAQGFYLNTPNTLHEITIKTGSKGYKLPIVSRIRVGTSPNLSSSYLAESESVYLDKNNTEYIFKFTQPLPLLGQQQYYFAISAVDDLTDHWFTLVLSSTDTYITPESAGSVFFQGAYVKFYASLPNKNSDLYFIMR